MARQLPPAIIAIGRNYADHAQEMGGAAPPRPVVFFKNPAALIGDGDPIIIPSICRQGGPQVDYEGELAVILAHDCLNVTQSDALGMVAGYAVANDVSARWWQNQGAGGQFSRGKSFDTFCPMSKMVSAAAVSDPQALRLTTRLNGECVQDASTAQMIFSVARLISDLSQGTTLLAGTILLTGTPAGVGHGRTPPRYLREGDTVDIVIQGVGSLSNRVIEAP
ncbi:MAG: fumarylacetoacetate hydrolase family protein [Phycisphaerales bacterium]|nr:fumarylacetoacetate hydrolase family protein [Phycisphaerales bacterium]